MSKAQHAGDEFGRVPRGLGPSGLIGKLRVSDARVYLAIATHADADYKAGPGVRRLAVQTGLHVGTVSGSIHRLSALGLLQIHWQGNGKSASYTLAKTVQCIPNADRSAHDDPTVRNSETKRSQFGDKAFAIQAQTVQRPLNETGEQKEKQKETDRDVLFLGADLPTELEGTDFHKAWSDWVAHLVEAKLPALTKLRVEKQLKALAAVGGQQAILAIDEAITRGWKSLHAKPADPADEAGTSPSPEVHMAIWKDAAPAEATTPCPSPPAPPP